jgi:O-succinylbenzoic acid--CoA ligase
MVSREDTYDLPSSFFLSGKHYGIEELREFARRGSMDPDRPEWMRKTLDFIRVFLDPDGPPVLQRSSGTTGKAKVFHLEREAMRRSAARTLAFFSLNHGDRVLSCLPADYIAGKMMVVRALLGGLDLVLTAPSSNPLKQVEGTFRFAAMVPMQLAGSLDEKAGIHRIGTLLLGGGEIHPALLQEISALELPEVYESFAMTETLSHFALRRINGPAPREEFRILEGVVIGTDERACLKVHVPGITPGPVQTNDLVEIGADGLGFRWLGRSDNVINSGGIKIIPEVLEERLGRMLKHPCLLIPEPDPVLGQRLVLMVETGPLKSLPMDEDDVMASLKAGLAPHEVPRRIVPVQAFPRNASFKPDRRLARQILDQD